MSVHASFNCFPHPLDMRRAPKVKSAHRKQKENIWRRKQREREQKKSIDKQRPRLPCKFFKNGTCKHVSCAMYMLCIYICGVCTLSYAKALGWD